MAETPLAAPAPDLVIRPATAADLPGVLALYAQPDFDAGDVLPLPQAEALLKKFARYPDYTLHVACENDHVVGTFALLVMDNIGHRGAPSAIVEDVAVDPARQGTGIGAAMMRFALARAAEKGCYKLMLSSNARRAAAHAFYEGLGFERHGYSFRVAVVPAPVDQDARTAETSA
ncbi:GNAT family N-acetyltransferase [Rhodoplanes elegans]|uniref:GNAT family N-acetyltransferase n=1 Tax=Rhodoplanes elegans TaxID=29408 RepID=A0A327K1C6_9BRAD|nr:GNAT family N-acetyltransferase [Rhodoplanes elegans]MBK5958332.1 GNAT family N-acetyltransferase [Rhodoplanes elegans]RAI31535.1 GNAT family N-acetyltransferase [Rhodoplanes elegans]